MTTLDQTYAAPKATGFGAFAAMLFSKVAAWNDARVTHKALSQLSDHELSDIGLCRGDIDALTTHR